MDETKTDVDCIHYDVNIEYWDDASQDYDTIAKEWTGETEPGEVYYISNVKCNVCEKQFTPDEIFELIGERVYKAQFTPVMLKAEIEKNNRDYAGSPR